VKCQPGWSNRGEVIARIPHRFRHQHQPQESC
jgi:hypothetical protein